MKTQNRNKVAVIGGGAWGSALACVAARAENETVLWCRSRAQVEEINIKNTNSAYLDELPLNTGIAPTADLDEALAGARIILLSVPTQSLGDVLTKFPDLSPDSILVTTCKGIDQTTGEVPTQVVRRRFGNHAVAVLSGPSFATDVVRNLPTAVTVASAQIEVAQEIALALSSGGFRCYVCNDVTGTELGGALKNVLALAVGAARGMKLGASAEAALIARGFSEITRLATRLGANPQTLMGLSGLGDMALTCSTPQSRNFTYGMALGRGDDRAGLRLAEGAFTAAVAQRLAVKNNVDVPITSAIVDVLEHRITASEAVQQLLTRPLKQET